MNKNLKLLLAALFAVFVIGLVAEYQKRPRYRESLSCFCPKDYTDKGVDTLGIKKCVNVGLFQTKTILIYCIPNEND